MTNISPNTLAKYEQAGEELGQFPSSINLVRLCTVLEIDPREIFDVIAFSDENEKTGNPFSFQWRFGTENEWSRWLIEYEDFSEMKKHLFDLSNALRRFSYVNTALLFMLAEKETIDASPLIEKLREIKKDPDEWANPDKWPFMHNPFDLGDLIYDFLEESLANKNGPDLTNPSRQQKETSEAADTAYDKPHTESED